MPISPREEVPSLVLPAVGGGKFDLAAARPRSFTMLAFYRGLHCPICGVYLRDLDQVRNEFLKLGVQPIAISTDTKDRAEQSKKIWGIEGLPIAYGLSIELARQWGLYISASIEEDEPALFAEPGLFLIRPDQTLYAASIQTMPFARPRFSEIREAIEFVTKNNYPARGEA